jgi:hypothetical protein
MRSGDVALRFSIVFAVAGFITIAAGIYEIDRREKSSSETVTVNRRPIGTPDRHPKGTPSSYVSND